MADYRSARLGMVESQLRPGGVTDSRVLKAMATVPREVFVPETRRTLSYLDEAIPVSPSRMMAAPAALGRLLQLADITTGDVVLDIACGTGYSSAVLAILANGVVALEEDAALVETANANLATLEVGNAAAIAGALPEGLPREAPFDVIVVEGAVDAVPEILLDQLREGGRLVAAIGRGNAAIAYRYLRAGAAVTRSAHFNLNLPVLEAFARQPTFQF